MRRGLLLGVAGLALPVLGAGLGASDYGFVDGVQVDKEGRATLLLVVDRPLEDGLTKPKVRSKILGYHKWVFVQGQLAKRVPDARVEKGVRLVILHPEPKNALGVSVLEQLVGYAKELRFESFAQPLPKKGK